MEYDSYRESQFLTTGEVITEESGFLRGHGTRVENETSLIATVSGFVENVNKLVSVRALNSRYHGEIGDVVVGRIEEVGEKRWKVDVNGQQLAVLQLSSIILPGGVQRRRTQADHLQMRTFFVENDLISAEVQNLHSDGAIALHTRSTKYGKLQGGQFIVVPQALVKRSKQHFVDLPCGVSVIFGNNGYIWVSLTPTAEERKAKEIADQQETPVAQPPKQFTPANLELVARVRNCIVALGQARIAIYQDTLMLVYEESIQMGLAASEILNPDILHRVTFSAAELCRSEDH